MYEDTLWNEAYVLYCSKDKKYRLINTEFRSNMHDAVYILIPFLKEIIKKFQIRMIIIRNFWMNMFMTTYAQGQTH